VLDQVHVPAREFQPGHPAWVSEGTRSQSHMTQVFWFTKCFLKLGLEKEEISKEKTIIFSSQVWTHKRITARSSLAV
jgi:hypothetical protein